MGDIGSDTLAGIEMMVEQYELLQSLQPSHPLLSYLSELTKEEFRVSPSFNQKYVAKADRYKVQAYGRYYLDLREAVTSIQRSSVGGSLDSKTQ